MSNELEALAKKLGEQLKKKHFKIVTAESCTGGGLGFWITSIPGSSHWYDRGYVTYSNQSKIDMLNVSDDTLNTAGAVSEETAQAMAEGALTHSNADLSIAITGIAGPDGGTPEKPIGTVWIASAGKNMRTIASMEIFPGNREVIRINAIIKAMQQLIMLTRV